MHKIWRGHGTPSLSPHDIRTMHTASLSSFHALRNRAASASAAALPFSLREASIAVVSALAEERINRGIADRECGGYAQPWLIFTQPTPALRAWEESAKRALDALTYRLSLTTGTEIAAHYRELMMNHQPHPDLQSSAGGLQRWLNHELAARN